jgi:hypothetical protein
MCYDEYRRFLSRFRGSCGGQMMPTLTESVREVEQFKGTSMTKKLAMIEQDFAGKDSSNLAPLYLSAGVHSLLFSSALELKRVASQIDTLIHAVGILVSLPSILKDGEVIQALSLGAGNTGKSYDLETNLRVAEYKFIDWKGGSESVRQDSLFKDFYYLAERDLEKEKYIYVLGTEHVLGFLRGGRKVSTVIKRYSKLRDDFTQKYGDHFVYVRDYYDFRHASVTIEDLSKVVAQFSGPVAVKASAVLGDQ